MTSDSMSPEGQPDRSPAERRFWQRLREDEERFLSEPQAWPRAKSAGWRIYGKGWWLCLYCDERFRPVSKKKPPHFCCSECKAVATRLRAEYREQIIRRLVPEGASDYEISGETGISPNVVRLKRYAMGLGGNGKGFKTLP